MATIYTVLTVIYSITLFFWPLLLIGALMGSDSLGITEKTKSDYVKYRIVLYSVLIYPATVIVFYFFKEKLWWLPPVWIILIVLSLIIFFKK